VPDLRFLLWNMEWMSKKNTSAPQHSHKVYRPDGLMKARASLPSDRCPPMKRWCGRVNHNTNRYKAGRALV